MTDSATPISQPAPKLLSENRLLFLLAAVQFTQVLDFMVMMPLGPQLMRDLQISAAGFGSLISAFALAAGIVGLASAPFIDRFDRRTLLLFCYAGFTVGTLACGLADTAGFLMLARILCGAFSGVAGATLMAIVSDVVPAERRARGMGIIMTAFSAAAAFGVPIGLKLAQWWKWEAPFLAIAGLSGIVWILLWRTLSPVRGHLKGGVARSGSDFLLLLRSRNAWLGILLMTVAVFGHFPIIPYLSPYLVANVGMPEKDLFLVYLVGGLLTIFTGPWVGRLADRHGKFRVYLLMVIGACAVIRTLTTLTPVPVPAILVVTGLFFVFASGRFIPAQATVSLAVPPARRGAYMSLIACSRDLAFGITAAIGGLIVTEGPRDELLHFDRLGLLAIGASLSSLWIFRKVRVAE